MYNVIGKGPFHYTYLFPAEAGLYEEMESLYHVNR